jgi:predicted site-specific integrase-resolvase
MSSGTEILNTAESCEILGVDRATLKRWVDSGKAVPLRKFSGPTGGYIFFRAHIEQLARDRNPQTGDEAAS